MGGLHRRLRSVRGSLSRPPPPTRQGAHFHHRELECAAASRSRPVPPPDPLLLEKPGHAPIQHPPLPLRKMCINIYSSADRALRRKVRFANFSTDAPRPRVPPNAGSASKRRAKSPAWQASPATDFPCDGGGAALRETPDHLAPQALLPSNAWLPPPQIQGFLTSNR